MAPPVFVNDNFDLLKAFWNVLLIGPITLGPHRRTNVQAFEISISKFWFQMWSNNDSTSTKSSEELT